MKVRLTYWHGGSCCWSGKEVVVEVPIEEDNHYFPPPPPHCTRLQFVELQQKQFPQIVP